MTRTRTAMGNRVAPRRIVAVRSSLGRSMWELDYPASRYTPSVAFRSETQMLRDRCEKLEEELAALREETARLDTELQERFLLLWPTRDPDLRQCRAHASIDLWFFAGGFGVGALVAAGFGNLGALFFAFLAAVPLQIRSMRTVVDRRQKAFATRFPWSPRALQAKYPIGDLEVRRHVKHSKGNKTITHEVVSNGRIVANGMSQAAAERLALEIKDFLGVQQGGTPLTE